jgi:hypothetical protein
MNNYTEMIKAGKKGSSIADRTTKIWTPDLGNFKGRSGHFRSFLGRLHFKE